MSFGVGDFIALSDLAVRVCTAYKDAPDNYRHISEEAAALQVLISEAEQYFQSPEIGSDDNEKRQKVLKGCQSVFEDLSSLLEKYPGLTSTNTSLLKRFQQGQVFQRAGLGMEDIATLRARITSNAMLLNGFIQICQMRAHAHRPNSRASIDSFTSFAGSINSKNTFKQFFKELYRAGVTGEIISQKGGEILNTLKPQNTVISDQVDGDNTGDEIQLPLDNLQISRTGTYQDSDSPTSPPTQIELSLHNLQISRSGTDQQRLYLPSLSIFVPPPALEIVGIALGLFPLVIEGIKFYISSAEMLKQMKHDKILNTFRRDLLIQRSIFENTWYTLGSRAGVHIKPNMETPSEITDNVLSCLPEYAVGSFKHGCLELNEILEKLREKFKEVRHSNKMLILLKRFPMGDCRQYIERISRLNSNLAMLVNGLPIIPKHRSVSVAGHLHARRHAVILYGALQEGLQKSSCSCMIPHSAYLRLDMCIVAQYHSHAPRHSLFFPVPAEQAKNEEYLTLRELEFKYLENPVAPQSNAEDTASSLSNAEDTASSLSNAEDTASEQETEPVKHLSISSIISRLRPLSPPQANRKKVMFSRPAVEIHSEISPVPGTSARVIESFCSTIQNITVGCADAGVLVSNNSKHQVWVPRAPLTLARVLSLAELLSLPNPPRGERLKLSVKLASSVLQFHETAWLQERWSKHDIYFVQGGSSQSESPSLDIPVVRQAFTPESSLPEASMEPCSIVSCNMSLFSLGIVLIELWFWRSVESFQVEPHHNQEDIDKYITANRLINDLYAEADRSYGDVVRRCIKGLDYEGTQLENEGFKNEVDFKIVQPLETYLEDFYNQSLTEIFEKRDILED